MEAAALAQAIGTVQAVIDELLAMGRPAYALALRLVGSPQDAEDIVQQAYLNACRSLRSGPPPDNARSWFLKVVANAAKNHLMSSDRRARRVETVRNMEQVASSGPDPEMLTALRAALEVLDPESRALVSLCYEHGCSQSEAAGILGIPARTASHRLRAGMERLRAALEAAGFTAASAAIVSGLAQTLPAMPDGLAAKVGSLVARETAASGLGSGAASTAPAGGMAMKVILGIAAAGALAAGVATVDLAGGRWTPRETGAAAPSAAAAGPAQGGPKREHFAFAGNVDYLDGPRLEALGSEKGRLAANDRDGNWYITCNYSTSWIRVIRVDGQVETIAGDDHWSANLNLEEGPAVCFPNFGMGPKAGNGCIAGYDLAIYGSPLKGEEQGSIYLFYPEESPYRIFKNKEKGGRWWFSRMGVPGKAKPPGTVGQSAKVDETDLTDAQIGIGAIVWEGNLYAFDEAKGEITCLLTVADYASKVEAIVGKGSGGKGLGPAEYIARADDGTIYVLYYWKLYPSGHVFKISADRTKFEHIVADDRNIDGSGTDGPGLHTKWHCGPGRIETTGNALVLHSVDSTTVRRYKDGRVSSLCYDGEWREVGSGKLPVRTVVCKGYNAAAHGLNYIHFYYPGEENGGDLRCYTFGPVDFTKPTVGPLVGEKGE